MDQIKSAGMPQGSSDEEQEEGLDWEKISGYGRFISGAIRRRWWLSGGVLMTTLSLTYLIYWLMPRTYHIETQLLAQKSGMVGALVSRQDQASPTRAAAETVLRRDNLVALAEKSELSKYWDEGRSNASRVKGWIYKKLGRSEMSEADKMDMFVGTLETRLSVETKADWGGEGTVTIALDWMEPKMGTRLVNAAQQSFVEARHLSEVSTISEAISILLGRAASMRDEIDATVSKIESKKQEKTERRRQAVTAAATELRERRAPSATTPGVSNPSDKETTQQLLALWEAKKAAIKDLEEMRRRRVGELQTRLTELRATYAESHPAIVDATQMLEALSQESPQLAQLKKEEAALHNQYLGRASRSPEATMGESLSRPLRSPSVRATAEPATGDDRETEFAKAQLRVTAESYDKLLERIEGMHMELEAARAALKYRYVVVKPAQRPREPIKPKPAKILGGGAAAALFLSILAAVIADLRSGKVYERWQLERALRLPVLAEIRRDN